MRLNSVRAGSERDRESPRGHWQSAIEKHRIPVPVRVTTVGVAGDDQADKVNHGGPDKAVLAYSVDHYSAWQAELHSPELLPGSLGENLEITGQSEADVCIGDTFRIHNVLFEVSQPRQPCWKPAWLHGIQELTGLIAATGRTGWYLRVLEEGDLTAPCDIELTARPNPDWTIERINRLIYHKAEGPNAKLTLAALPQLSHAWRKWLRGEA